MDCEPHLKILASAVMKRRRKMISAPLQADNDNDWAASALLLLTRCGDGTLDLCRSGVMAGVRLFGISGDQDLHLPCLAIIF